MVANVIGTVGVSSRDVSDEFSAVETVEDEPSIEEQVDKF